MSVFKFNIKFECSPLSSIPINKQSYFPNHYNRGNIIRGIPILLLKNITGRRKTIKMQYKALVFFASMAAALPAPQIQTPTGNEPFGLIAMHSGSAVHLQSLTASKGSIKVGGTQDATCASKSPNNSATFFLSNGGMGLFTSDATPQQVWTDRSGMGQGVTGYTSGAQKAPRNGEYVPFSIDGQGNIVFDGTSPQACPINGGADGWSIWFSDAKKPGYNEGCIGVALMAVKAETPVRCVYTSS
jgi:hypothetical protein